MRVHVSRLYSMYMTTAAAACTCTQACNHVIKTLHKNVPATLLLKYSAVIVIKTHDSESRGQEEAGRTRRMSVLFTGSTAVKFVNALNKPPLKLSLSYQRLSTF